MSLLHFNLSGFGLDISDLSIKIAQITSNSRRGNYLSAWGKVDIKPGLIERGVIIDRERVVSEIAKLKDSVNGKLTSNFAVACLPEAKVFIKVLEIAKDEKLTKKKSEDKLISAIEKELPKEIPLPVENIEYDYQIVSEDKSSWQILVGAAPRDIISEYNETIKAAGFNLLALEIEAQAIVRALIREDMHGRLPSFTGDGILNSSYIPNFIKSRIGNKNKVKEKSGDNGASKNNADLSVDEQSGQLTNPKNNKPTIIVDLGAARSSVIVFHKKSIRLTRSIPLSGTSITEEIAKSMKLTMAKAEQAKIVCGLDEKKCKGKVKPIIENWVDELVKEISTTMTYYHGSSPSGGGGFDKLLLCGGAAALKGLPGRLSDELGISVQVANSLDGYNVSVSKGVAPIPHRSVPGFATVVGLALRST